jgi:hypothetical protein
LCRFSAAGNDETIRVLGWPAAEKRQGRKSRWVGHDSAAGAMGNWPRRISVGGVIAAVGPVAFYQTIGPVVVVND